MKNRILALLLLLSLALSFAACGEYVPAVDPTETESGSDTETDTDTETSENNGEPFTVTIKADGVPYKPTVAPDDENALKVRFTDGKTYHTVSVGADGVAVAEGLDGDYTVTLLNLPEGYTYDPNIHIADNDHRNISIELLPLTLTSTQCAVSPNGSHRAMADSPNVCEYCWSGMGTDSYYPIEIPRTGVYRAIIEEPGQVVYFEYMPRNSGSYGFESLMDTGAGMFNPLVDVYRGGSVGFNIFIERVDGGGASGGYTKNFKHVIDVDEEYLGNGYVFGVLVEGKDATYPTYVDFELSYLGTYAEEWATSTLVSPEFIPGSVLPDGTRSDNAFLLWRSELFAHLDANKQAFGSAEYVDSSFPIGGRLLFDQTYYKLNPDDQLYHVYDEAAYASTGGWGPILYADITVPNIFMGGTTFPSAFNVVEYNGNKALTLCEGTVNYKLFIEGFDPLTMMQSGQSGAYFCNSDCPCYQEYIGNAPGNNGGVCTIEENCTQCKEECRHIPASMKYQKGYAQIVNEDGRAPVTEELKLFLQRYSENQRLFSDGNGWVETYGNGKYTAYEDSQWLFACGYYTD